MTKEWKSITRKELLDHFGNGLWHKEIAAIYEVSEKTVRNTCSVFNIVLERKNKSKAKEKVAYICKVCKKEFYTKNDGYCSANCRTLEKNLSNLDLIDTPTTELGVKIVELRKLGLSQKKIAEELKCSKSTVSYYCSPKTKNTIKERENNYKLENRKLFSFKNQVSLFRNRVPGKGKILTKNMHRKITAAVSFFKNRNEMKVIKNYTYKDAIEHLGGEQTRCYLTGQAIDINKDDYCLDHIVPVSKGGNNELENMGITTPIANASKTDLTLEEYLLLCKQVLENFGYIVEKN
jgi:orotate phosphoribosyltransferase-like protein